MPLMVLQGRPTSFIYSQGWLQCNSKKSYNNAQPEHHEQLSQIFTTKLIRQSWSLVISDIVENGIAKDILDLSQLLNLNRKKKRLKSKVGHKDFFFVKPGLLELWTWFWKSTNFVAYRVAQFGCLHIYKNPFQCLQG